MSGRDLYRSVLRGAGCESPQFTTSGDLSPMSNLAFSLHGTSLSHTPRRRLSLSSNVTDTPQSCLNDSTQLSISSTPGDLSSDSSSSLIEEPAVSPRRHVTASSRNKENCPSPYYSPSRLPPRSRASPSPLQEVQNTVNRSLDFSPLKKNLQMVSPSKRQFTSPQKPSPPDDFDTTSQDSGYSDLSGKKVEEDCFSVPISCAPRKLNLDLSPPKAQKAVSPLRPSAAAPSTTGGCTTTSTPVGTGQSGEGRRPFIKFSSLTKGEEDDAMMRDLMNEVTPQDYKPLGFSKLLAAPLQPPKSTSSPKAPRPSIRRCLSMVHSVCKASAVQSENTCSFKRPDPPSDSYGQDSKRRKLDVPGEQLSPLTSNGHTTTQTRPQTVLTQRQTSAPEANPAALQTAKPKWHRCHSESHVSIMKALNKSSGHDGNLTGDFSKPMLLPILEGGKHPDLKSISVDTVADVVRGKYKSKLASCRIIDCRYPYEYEGGHIKGAEMWHLPELVSDHLKARKGAPVIAGEDEPRHIMVFHCEFSAERGPKTQRMLREIDRTANKEHYPALHFPETYLLEGGYKSFYENYPELCTPNDYVKMLDPKHNDDFKHFRGKSKSWAAENKQSKSRNAIPRTGLKRLGL
ncbi:M-phase inducer phosphatase [Chionoecetes opilio]|uniref:M-phase inducer phosphatase n=1 Tax=Chionoecetes opilio TaxID=41210 RepID=A0A8J4XS75_CHIOP|nr:M-phase inducer phosphatase [Chionoecetes opilio]